MHARPIGDGDEMEVLFEGLKQMLRLVGRRPKGSGARGVDIQQQLCAAGMWISPVISQADGGVIDLPDIRNTLSEGMKFLMEVMRQVRTPPQPNSDIASNAFESPCTSEDGMPGCHSTLSPHFMLHHSAGSFSCLRRSVPRSPGSLPVGMATTTRRSGRGQPRAEGRRQWLPTGTMPGQARTSSQHTAG